MKKLLSVLLVTALVLAALPLTALPVFAVTSGDFYYKVLSETDKTCEITGYTGWATALAIPSELDGYTVTSIGECAFYYCTSLTSITIPDSVTSIGELAFSGCTALTDITIPDSVTSIGQSTFSGCTALTSITLPYSVTIIENYAFVRCIALTNITIPDSVTGIGDHAFYNTAYYNDATHWENNVLYIGNHLIEAKDTLSGAYTIREGTKTIADWAFSGCTALESITIPDSVTSIGYRAFYCCTALTSITIPDSVKSIGYEAFYCCTALASITIPDSVTSISDYAFSGCTLLTTIYGYTGSYAETYAVENGYTFIALDLVKNDETDISVLFPPENLPPENTVLNVEKLSAEENTITYDITLTVNDEIVQPASAVTVKIPAPATMDGAQCKVYRQETDETYTDMHATYQDGYMVFTTDHFGTYVLTTADPNVPTYTLGDVNGDDKINAVDARWVLQAASGVRTFDAVQTAAADVNGDGKVNAVDARWILQVASGARTL